MARLTFPFVKYKTKSGETLKEPKIPVTYIGKNGPIDAVAIVDSGSTVSYLPLDFAETLGFEIEKAESEDVDGIGGKERVGRFKIGLKITRKNQEVRIDNMPVFVFLDKTTNYFILGMEPFFERFDVSFKLLDDKIELREASARMKRY